MAALGLLGLAGARGMHLSGPGPGWAPALIRAGAPERRVQAEAPSWMSQAAVRPGRVAGIPGGPPAPPFARPGSRSRPNFLPLRRCPRARFRTSLTSPPQARTGGQFRKFRIPDVLCGVHVPVQAGAAERPAPREGFAARSPRPRREQLHRDLARTGPPRTAWAEPTRVAAPASAIRRPQEWRGPQGRFPLGAGHAQPVQGDGGVAMGASGHAERDGGGREKGDTMGRIRSAGRP